MKKIIEKIIIIFVYGIMLFTLYAITKTMLYTLLRKNDVLKTFGWMELIWIVAAIIIFFITYMCAKRVRDLNRACILLIGTLLTITYSVILILNFKTIPVSDYKYIWDNAIMMANNTFTIDKYSYMYYYNWQIGITFFESLIIKMLGERFWVLQIINIASMSIINILIYITAEEFISKKAGVYAYFTAVQFIPWIITTPQFSNHHPGTIFLLLAMYLVKKNKWYTWLLAGVCVALLEIIRPIAIIFIIAAICVLVYNLISTRSGKPIIYFLSFLCSLVMVESIFNFTFIKNGYTDQNITDARIPYFKLQKGLYGYNDVNNDIVRYEGDYELYNKDMKKQLVEKIKNNKKEIILNIKNKYIFFMGNFDYQFEHTYNHDSEIWTKYPIKALYSTGWFQYLFLIILALIGYRRYKSDPDIFQMYFIGNSLVYLFVEAWPSYRFESYPFLMLMAGIGVSALDKDVIKSTKFH